MNEAQVAARVPGVLEIPGEVTEMREREGANALRAHPPGDETSAGVVRSLGGRFVPCEGGLERQGRCGHRARAALAVRPEELRQLTVPRLC